MPPEDSNAMPHWSSRWVFVLAATGAAVGLGNFWRFPYMVGEAGGAFVLVYFVFMLAMALPLFMAELMLGKSSKQNPIFAIQTMAAREGSGSNPVWNYLGWVMTITGVLILSYYSVVAGWILAYALRTALGLFQEISTVEEIRSIFTVFVSDPEKLLAWHTIFVFMTVCVSGRDFRRGMENMARLFVPAMFALLFILLLHGLVTQALPHSLISLLHIDFSRLTASHVMHAMQQAFFSLSLGVGVMLAFGAYLGRTVSVVPISFSVVVLDTVAALLAAGLIYPVVLATELEFSSGVTLLFQTVPMAFGALPGGAYWGTLFFIVLVLAAWTSAIALLEPSIAWLTARFGWRRAKAAILTGLIVWLLGLLNILSLNYWAFAFKFFGMQMVNGWLDILDIMTSTVLLPLIALLVAVFTGWVVSREYSKQQLGSSILTHAVWLVLIRFAVPGFIVVVFAYLLLH